MTLGALKSLVALRILIALRQTNRINYVLLSCNQIQVFNYDDDSLFASVAGKF